jgi:PAS domain S-box-containing protein
MTAVRIRNEPQSSLALMMGLCVGALGTLVLVGWMFNLAVLKSVFPGLVSMKSNTAIGMLLCGSALAILSRTKVAMPGRFWTTMVAVVVIALGALNLGEYLFGWELGLDQWLFRDADFRVGISQPGRMSPATAFCFVLTGVSLLAASQPASMRLRRSILAAQGLALVIVSGLAFIGYASDALFNWRWWSYTGMAVHTAAGFMLLGFGLLALGSNKGGFKWSLDALTTGGFVTGIAMLLGAAGIAYHFTLQLQESAAWVSHTQEVLKEIGGITAGVASIGSSQRNYINTGDDRFLEKEAGIKDALHQNIATLRKLTADNPRQQPRLNQLDPLLDQRIDWGEQTIAARRKDGLSAAEQMIATGKGIELNNSIRGVITALEDEEYSLLDRRQKKEKSISSTTFLLLPLGVFLSVTLLSLGLFVLNTGMGERAQAQEKADWLASFPERNPSHIVELDVATGTIHYVNPFTLRFLPDLESQGMQHPWLAGLEEAASALREGQGEPLRREIAAGGRYYAQTINYIPETKRVRVYGNDITERKGVEATAARMAAIVESSDDAIIGKDLQGVVTSWNAGAERLFGYPACEMVGQPIMRLIPPERQQEEEEILNRVRAGQNVRHFDTERVHKDGSMVAISVTVSPIKDSTGKIIGASKVARDISERKQAEKALRETQARLHSTLAAGSIGTWTWDIVNDRLVADEFTARLFSIKADAAANGLPAEAYLQAVFEKDRQSVADALARAIKACSHYDIEYRVRQESGELRWLKARGRVDSDCAGKANAA